MKANWSQTCVTKINQNMKQLTKTKSGRERYEIWGTIKSLKKSFANAKEP